MRWRGGAITELVVALPRSQPPIRTDEDTVELMRRLAVHYPDATIAGILNRQGVVVNGFQRPPRRRRRGHRPEQFGLLPKHGQVGDGLATMRDQITASPT